MLRAIRKRTNVKISILKSLRKENPNRLIFAQINLNSINNKFQFLASQIINHVDVLLVSEIKLGDSFSTVLLEGFSKQFRLDRCSNGGGILLYVKATSYSRLLIDHRLLDNVEHLLPKLAQGMRNGFRVVRINLIKIIYQITYSLEQRSWQLYKSL